MRSIATIPAKDPPAAGQDVSVEAVPRDHMLDGERVWRERSLRSAVLAGDERAWQAWYDESYCALYAYVSWRCGGIADLADELTQETWLVAVRRLRTFEPDRASFAAWLRGIAANAIRNHFRAKRRAAPVQQLNGQEIAKDHDGRPDGERIALAFAAVSERHEAVLRAKYLDRRSIAEIAGEWGESEKAIESLLTRARDAFRNAFTQQE
jgi:RNA polymerase sigma-70 factor, ECF subfamily